MKNIYLVGIKGVGMTALAVYLKGRGKKIWGSDVEEEFPTENILRENNITILTGFSPKNITKDIDLVITTGAHQGLSNPEVLEAKNKKIKIMTLAEEVGHLMQAYKHPISICGTHGKTTVSSMAAYVLSNLHLATSHLVGAPSFSGLPAGKYGGTDYFVVEADEYVASKGTDETPRFMYQDPEVIVCTNIDFDHPDVFDDIDHVKKVFTNFFNKLENNKKGKLIYYAEDEHIKSAASNVPSDKKLSYGFSDDADYTIENIKKVGDSFTFSVKTHEKSLGVFSIQLPGKHNILNATAVIVLTVHLGFNSEKVKEILAKFSGSARRFEKIFEINNIYLFDDYAHHPKEIEETIKAARMKFPGQRIIMIFQPHTYSRTHEFKKEFVKALSSADNVYLLDIFASAREKIDFDISSKDLVNEAQKDGFKNIKYLYNLSDVSKLFRSGDIIITAGAGNIYTKHNDIINFIKHTT